MAPSDDGKQLIEKKIIHAGHGGQLSFSVGTKVSFHFQTKRCDNEKVLDDSRTWGKPMELLIGKKFKLEVWESCVQTMGLGEVTQFTVDKSLVINYPFVAKTLRESNDPKKKNDEPSRSHCCGMMALQTEEGLGYPDLNEMLKTPQDLVFIIELLKVEGTNEYEKESWQMDIQEKLDSVPRLRDKGNELYRNQDYEEASKKYAEAIGRLEQLILREKPGDEEYEKLDQMKVPLLLNFSQCKLLAKEYYPVIEHCSEVLTKDPVNVKALFRRAKAHSGVWNFKEARKDYSKVVELDNSLRGSVKKELNLLNEVEKKKELEEREKLQGKMFGT